MRQLAVWADCDPALLDEERVRSFFLHLKLERGWSSKSIRQARASLTAFFNGMLGFDWAVFDTIKTKDVFKLPSVLTREEVRLILAAVREPRFRVPLRLIYECGLRMGEALRVNPKDIKREKLRLHVHLYFSAVVQSLNNRVGYVDGKAALIAHRTCPLARMDSSRAVSSFTLAGSVA